MYFFMEQWVSTDLHYHGTGWPPAPWPFGTLGLLHGRGVRILAGGTAIRRIIGVISRVILILVIGRDVHIIHHHAGQVAAYGFNHLLLPQQGFQRQFAGLDDHERHIHLAHDDGGITDAGLNYVIVSDTYIF